jgi:hypothetical protein
MKFRRWSWGYIPVAAVLALIWYEFWQSGTFTPPQREQTPTIADPSSASTGGEPRAAINPEPDDTFLYSPPPISVSFSNVSLDSAIESLRQALGPMATIQLVNSGGPQNRTFSIDMKNASFWDVFRVMGEQAPLEIHSAEAYEMDGLVLTGIGNGLHRFEVNGPAILYPINITYNRQGSGQRSDGEPSAPEYRLRVGAAVDPRVRVTSYAPVEVLNAVDDMGRMLVIPDGMGNFNARPTNCWDTTLRFNAAEPHGKRATLKCQVRFTAQISEHTVTVDDATRKVGQRFVLGDQGMRLGRCEVQGDQIILQVVQEIPQPAVPIAFKLEDSKGRSVGLQTQSGATRPVQLNNMTGPFRLVFRAPDEVRALALAFELKDIPLP